MNLSHCAGERSLTLGRGITSSSSTSVVATAAVVVAGGLAAVVAGVTSSSSSAVVVHALEVEAMLGGARVNALIGNNSRW